MDKDMPEYLQLNPIFNGLKVDVMTNHEIVLEKDFFNNIIMVRKKVPVKMYLNTQKKDDMSDIKNYHLNAFLGNKFQ